MAQLALLVVVFALLCGLRCEVEGKIVKQSAGNGLSDAEKAEILRAHNHYRGRVDPIATNMEMMEWSEELAYHAHFWAVGCEYELNEDRHAQSTEFDYIGQSLLATGSYTVNYTILIQSWFTEGQNYNYYTLTCTDEDGNEEEEGCQRYLQLVWARTDTVGCGAIRCAELSGSEDAEENALFLVCNYGPGGSYVGKSPYQTGGDPCSACTSDKPHCINNLCSAESGDPPMVTQVSLLGVLMVTMATLLL